MKIKLNTTYRRMANKAQGPFYPTQIQQCQPNSENNITILILQFQGFLSKQAEKAHKPTKTQ